jgi:hypothetical protein
MSFTTTVRVERESDSAHDTLVARVTLYPCAPWECPDPAEVQWLHVIEGCGEITPAEASNIALEEYDDWAIELAQDEFREGCGG